MPRRLWVGVVAGSQIRNEALISMLLYVDRSPNQAHNLGSTRLYPDPRRVRMRGSDVHTSLYCIEEETNEIQVESRGCHCQLLGSILRGGDALELDIRRSDLCSIASYPYEVLLQSVCMEGVAWNHHSALHVYNRAKHVHLAA